MVDTFPISGSGGVGMPFRGMTAMDQRREFVVFAAVEGANVRLIFNSDGHSAGRK